jgi:hypothetical protein
MSDCALSPQKFVNILIGCNKSVGEDIGCAIIDFVDEDSDETCREAYLSLTLPVCVISLYSKNLLGIFLTK